jgi:hypothetical protein
MAKNVLEIRTSNHCNIHNRACLNKDNNKESHIEITFMMLSIWASEIVTIFIIVLHKYNLFLFT